MVRLYIKIFAYKLVRIKTESLFDFAIFVYTKHSFLDHRRRITMELIKRNLRYLPADPAG